MSSEGSSAPPAVLAVAAAITIAACGRGCFVDQQTPLRAAKTMGFEDAVLVHRSDWWAGMNGCGSGDAASFKYRAKNSRGAQVEILVCCGWPIRACTVRLP